MIERATIEGREATVAYLTHDMKPAGRDAATLIKIHFDDGEIRFAVTAAEGGDSDDADANSE